MNAAQFLTDIFLSMHAVLQISAHETYMAMRLEHFLGMIGSLDSCNLNNVLVDNIIIIGQQFQLEEYVHVGKNIWCIICKYVCNTQ